MKIDQALSTTQKSISKAQFPTPLFPLKHFLKLQTFLSLFLAFIERIILQLSKTFLQIIQKSCQTPIKVIFYFNVFN